MGKERNTGPDYQEILKELEKKTGKSNRYKCPLRGLNQEQRDFFSAKKKIIDKQRPWNYINIV